MRTETGTEGDEAPVPGCTSASCASCVTLVADLERYSTTLEGLERVFRATAGERAEVRAEVFGDVGGSLRSILARHYRRAGL